MATEPIGNIKTVEQIIQKATTQNSKDRKTGEMGKDQFLQLLITQLSHQDPMNPVDDKEFIGQMAQFSSLEQMQNMNASFSGMRAASYLGKQAKATYVDDATKVTTDVSGIISNVKVLKDKVSAIINGQEIPIENISEITETGLDMKLQDISKYTGYIGFNVKGTISDQSKNKLDVIGRVREVSKGPTDPNAIIDDVKLQIVDFQAPPAIKAPQAKADYLKTQIGNEVTVTTHDNTNKGYIKVKGILKDCNVDNLAEIHVKLDNLQLSVADISSVTNAAF